MEQVPVQLLNNCLLFIDILVPKPNVVCLFKRLIDILDVVVI